ncbi:MAG: hypothetical protein ACPKNR_09415 [Pleomorphochaeta sp.]
MMQVWFLTIIYLIYTGLLLITGEYGVKLPILLNMREYLLSKRYLFIIIMFVGYILTIFNCFIPNIPGPIFLGDLFPTIALFVSSLWYNIILFKSKKTLNINQEKRKLYKKMAIFIFSVAVLHLFFPTWVLL